jgi:hypothetical protein
MIFHVDSLCLIINFYISQVEIYGSDHFTVLLENICKKKGIKTDRGRKDIKRSLHLRRNYRATTQEIESLLPSGSTTAILQNRP